MAEPLVFYTNPMSRGRIARWMLEEVGEPYETQLLEYGESMKADDYLALNPMGKVPALQHGDTVVTEVAAICAYLADAFPSKQLAPPLPERSAYYRWLFFAAGPMEMGTSMKTLNVEVKPENQAMLGFGNYSLFQNALAHWLESHEYVAASFFTAADVYVGAHVNWGMQMGTLEPQAAFKDYTERVHQRPAAIRAAEIDDALVKR